MMVASSVSSDVALSTLLLLAASATAAGAAEGGVLQMHKITSCGQCGRAAQGQPGSWCPCPDSKDPRCVGGDNANCS